jgi:lysophospholipase L1-like esterase
MLTGDSFSDDQGDWTGFVTNATLFSTATTGQQLVNMPSSFEENLDTHVLNSGVNTAIIQGGVNDISSSSVNLEMMQAAVIEMVDVAEQKDLDIIIFNIAPWNSATSQVKRDEIDNYNSWLDAYTSQEGITLVDMYTAVVDVNNPQNTKSEFDLDGIHLNRDGAMAVAEVFDSAISEIPIPISVWLFFSGLIVLSQVSKGTHAQPKIGFVES